MEHQAADSKAEQMNRWLSSDERPSDTVEGRQAFDLVCRLHTHDALMRECELKPLADPLEQSRRIAALTDERNELAARLDAVCNQAGAPAPVVNRGTPKALTDAQEAEVVRLFDRGRGVSVNKLAQRFGVSNPTIDKALRRAGVKS